MNLELEFKDRVARRAVSLLPLKQVAMRLQTVVSAPKRSLWQLTDVIKSCPLLAASVMRLASSASGLNRVVTNLAQATARLSEEELARLALAAGLGASDTDASPLFELRRGVMQDCLTAGLICERLAPEFDLPPDDLFLAGLLHDVGTLIALGTLEQLIALHPGSAPRAAAEWMVLARQHHVELGELLAEQWGLPAEVRRAIARHHEPDDGVVDATAVVRISDELLALVHSGAALGEEQLPWLQRIAPGRRARLLDKLAGVPAQVAAFGEQRPYASSSSSISMAPPSRAPQRHPRFPAKVSGGRTGEVQLLSPCQLLLKLQTPLPQNYLAELEVEFPGQPLKLWVRVTASSTVGMDGLAEAEVVPFAPTVSAAERLEALWCEQEELAQERAA